MKNSHALLPTILHTARQKHVTLHCRSSFAHTHEKPLNTWCIYVCCTFTLHMVNLKHRLHWHTPNYLPTHKFNLPGGHCLFHLTDAAYPQAALLLASQEHLSFVTFTKAASGDAHQEKQQVCNSFLSSHLLEIVSVAGAKVVLERYNWFTYRTFWHLSFMPRWEVKRENMVTCYLKMTYSHTRTLDSDISIKGGQPKKVFYKD